MSSRMMDFKPLLPFGGTTVIQHTVSRMLEGGAEEIILVTGFLATEVERIFRDSRVRFVHNRDYAKSQMFDSVCLGLAAARGDEIFLLPADLPQIDPTLLNRLSAIPAQAVYPVCHGKNGHPLLLRRSGVETVLLHDGTRDLKGALERLDTQTIETEDLGCLLDIDNPEQCSGSAYRHQREGRRNVGQGKKLQRRLLLHEEVSQYIKETILAGELKPGDRIVESRLAQELGVSQAPVREALRELEFSGLVEQKPFSGTYVKQVTVKEIRQFYEVRAALERLGAECAAQRMNEEQYQELAMTMFSMEEAARDHDLSEYIKCDARFHDQIVAAANNDLLSRLWEQCNIRSWLHVGTSLTGRDLPELASRHRRIFEALRSKDLEQLRAAIDAHLNDLLKMMEENQGEKPAAESI